MKSEIYYKTPKKVTRSLLEVMVQDPPDYLLVQTRSPLVRRDIDLLQRLENRVRVSMTVETDREDIRKLFTPEAPPISARLKTLELMREAGIPSQVSIAPVLPITPSFPDKLKGLNIDSKSKPNSIPYSSNMRMC